MLYSVEKLISEARTLAADYRNATGKTLALSSEIALHDAITLLELDPAEQEDGFDAVDQDGGKILIKGRVLFGEQRSSPRVGQFKLTQPWDAVVLVLMDDSYHPFEIYRAERDVVESLQDETDKSSRSSRGQLSVARFKIIGDLVWERDEE
ncbi:MAG: hypothetical protein HN963_02095 [Thiotrichales bacterium]|nr:hypothetical protein [Thiotrichales bacterium]